MVNKDFHNSKTNDPKVFKLGIGNDLEISLFYALASNKQRNTIFILAVQLLLVVVFSSRQRSKRGPTSTKDRLAALNKFYTTGMMKCGRKTPLNISKSRTFLTV